MFWRILLILLLFQSISNNAFALILKQSEKPVTIELSHNKPNTVTADVFIKNGWAVYANKLGDSGYQFEIQLLNPNNIIQFTTLFPTPEVMTLMRDNAVYVYKDHVQIDIILDPHNKLDDMSARFIFNYGVCNDVCAVFSDEIDYMIQSAITLEPGKTRINIKEFILMILIAIVGGFILNFMPCVLPVLSLKIINLTKYKGVDKKNIRLHLLATICGIITSFVCLGAFVLLLKSTGQSVGWGMHFQEPIFLMIIVIVMIFFAHNLWGFFEIAIPSQALDAITHNRSKYVTDFVIGVVGTLLATPCTAPFLSTSVAFALMQSDLMIIFIYVSIGIGMAIPYFLLMISPNILKFMPKSGNWMIVIKKAFSLMLMATAIWMTYILYYQINSHSLLLFIALLFISKTILVKIHHIKRLWFALTLLGCIVMTIGSPYLIEQKRKSDTQLMNTLWEPYSEASLQSYIEDGRTVLVDVTAEWCMTCKYNKYFVLEQRSLLDFLQDHDVILMRADYTNKSQEIADFMQKHNRFGIPLNVLYSVNYPQGFVLPEILTQSQVIVALKKSSQ